MNRSEKKEDITDDKKGMWDDEANTFEDDNPLRSAGVRRYVSIDYGTANPCVFLDVSDDGSVYWIANEYYWDSNAKRRQKTDAEYAEDLEAFLGGDRNVLVIIDPSAASLKAELRKRGYRIRDAKNEVREGIAATAVLIGSRAVKVHRKNCPCFLREIHAYLWDLWEAQVSLSVPSGISVSETVRRILAASGTGIQLLSFSGADSVFSRGQAFYGRAPDCLAAVLSAVSARAYLVPAGLCVIPAEPPEATLHLHDKDLTDRPAFADGGRKMILSTTVTGFQPGEEMTLETKGKTYSGLILERMVEADTALGPWSTQLLIELH